MSEYKVGQELAFRWRYQSGFVVFPIKRITPSGRILCGPYVLNPDLTVYGRNHYGPFRAEVVTAKIRESVERESLLQQLSNFDFSTMSIERMRTLVATLPLPDDSAADLAPRP